MLLAKYSNAKVVVAGHTHNDQHCLSLNNQYVTPSSFVFATYHQDHSKHQKEDFWAAHALDPSRIGFRWLQLENEEVVKSAVVWV